MSVDKLKSSLKKVLEEAVKSIKNVNSLSDLESMRVRYLGKKSSLNSFMKTLSDLSASERAQAGKDLNVRAGCPNLIERIESGLLSFGSDMTRQNTPVEAGLAKFCNSPDDYLGKATIEKQKRDGPARIVCPISISGDDDLPHNETGWKVLSKNNQVGLIASAAWSPDFQTNVSIGMIERGHWDAGTVLNVDTGADIRSAEVQEKFWI